MKTIGISIYVRACEALKKCLPEILHDPSSKFITDEIVKKWHINLLENVKIYPSIWYTLYLIFFYKLFFVKNV